MKKQIARLFRKAQRFHHNESGADTLEVILILALAALAAVAIYKFGERIVQFASDCLYGYAGGEE